MELSHFVWRTFFSAILRQLEMNSKFLWNFHMCLTSSAICLANWQAEERSRNCRGRVELGAMLEIVIICNSRRSPLWSKEGNTTGILWGHCNLSTFCRALLCLCQLPGSIGYHISRFRKKFVAKLYRTDDSSIFRSQFKQDVIFDFVTVISLL